MSTASAIITKVRDTVNDPDGDRWSDARIIRSINDAMKSINLEANILRSKYSFDLVANTHTYQLPGEVQKISRCVYNNEAVAFKSHQEMDAMYSTWEEDTKSDEVTYVIYDKLNQGQIRIYPIPESNISGVSSLYGVVAGATGFTLNSVYGVVTGINETQEGIIVYYIKKPTPIVNAGDELELNDIWDKAIKHYVCSELLRDDKDTQSRAFGNEELELYINEVRSARDYSSADFTASNQYETSYRGI
jgi:hypothetical protein